MKTRLIALAAATALTAFAGAAAAQPYGYGHDNDRYEQGRYEQGRYGDRDRWDRGAYNINQRQAELDRRIDAGVRRGTLTREEAWRLRGEFRELARLEARYRVNGLTGRERADLDRRFDRLESRISRQIRDRDYGYGYGYRR